MANNTYVLDSAKVFGGQYDFSGAHQIAAQYSYAKIDDSDLSVAAKTEDLGKMIAELSWEINADGSQGVLAMIKAVGGTADVPFSITIPSGAQGDPCWMAKGALIADDFARGGENDFGKYACSVATRTDAAFGEVNISAAAALTTTTNGTAVQLGAITNTNYRLHAWYHILAASGSSPTLDLTVESDTVGMSSPTTRITFAQATAVGSGYSTKDGAVTDDYWRFVATIGGGSPSFTVMCGFAIHVMP